MSEENKATETKKQENKKAETKKPKTFKEYLDNEEKANIRIPIDPQNPKDLFVRVALNGAIYQIQRGENVEIPKSIAQILREAKYI